MILMKNTHTHNCFIKVVVDVVDEESDEEMRMFKEAMYGKKPPEEKNEEEDNEEKFDLDDTDQQIAMVRVCKSKGFSLL